MDEKLIERIYAALKRICVKNGGEPVTVQQLAHARIRWYGGFVTTEQIRTALDIFCAQNMVSPVARFGAKSLDYIPIQQKTPQEKIVDAVREGFRATQFFDHIPTDDEIIAVLNDKLRFMIGSYMKTEIFTRDGAIARQLVERLHFEFFVVKPGFPVRVSYLLEDDPEAIMPSTLAIRKRMLADLAAKGFLRIEKNKAIPITPYPAWSVYARNKQ